MRSCAVMINNTPRTAPQLLPLQHRLYVESLGYEFATMFMTFVCIICLKFVYFASQICVNLNWDIPCLTRKQKWQSLHIFLKPPCINVRYFEWTYWYSSIWLLLLCSFDLGLCQGDLNKIWVDNDIRFSTSILCTKNYN